MRLLYILLSPTFGMHQYTAGLANRMVEAGHEVHLLTTPQFPRDRYASQVAIHTPVNTRDTGFSADGLRFRAIPNLKSEISNLESNIVHFTGPHLWNPILLAALRRADIPTIHTIHDANPHAGAGYGRLLYAWNNLVYRWADHILVHGQVYHDDLIARGVSSSRVTHMPLLHLFLSYASATSYQPSAVSSQTTTIHNSPFALFFARLEVYKGVNVLIEAMRLIEKSAIAAGPALSNLPWPVSQPVLACASGPGDRQSPTPNFPRAIIAGKGNLSRLGLDSLPANVEIRNRLIEDDEAIELFSRCSLLVLPYVEASQSALVAAAYFFGKPVIVTRVGALPEYVVEGETGWIVEPGDPRALADCVRMALSDPARLAQMGQAGQRWYNAQRQLELETLQAMYGEMGNREGGTSVNA